MKHLGVRLVLATLIPTVLITITLAPFVWSNIQNRLDHARTSAQAQLEAEYDVLLQDMNESINHALAVAEFPNIEHYLQSAQQTHSPYQEGQLKQNREQLDDMFKTLLTHFGRYTRLALIGKDGDEHFSTQHSGARTTKRNHSETRYFMEAMILEPRSLYVSPPHLAPGIAGPEITTGVMDIATPVFGRDGQRLGVLLLTLDWGSLAGRFLRAIDAQSGAVALLVDANGSWLLPTEASAMPFGGLLQTRWPDAWQAMQVANRGSASVGDNLLFFRTHDIRTHHFRSQAEQVFGLWSSELSALATGPHYSQTRARFIVGRKPLERRFGNTRIRSCDRLWSWLGADQSSPENAESRGSTIVRRSKRLRPGTCGPL